MNRKWLYSALALVGLMVVAVGALRAMRPAGLPSDPKSTSLVQMDLATKTEHAWLKVPGHLKALAIAPGGGEVATVAVPSTAHNGEAWLMFWSLPEGRFLRRFDLAKTPWELTWLDDHSVLVGAGSEAVQVRAALDGRVIRTLPPSRAGLRVHPNQPWVADFPPTSKGADHAQTFRITNVLTGKVLHQQAFSDQGIGAQLAWVAQGTLLALIQGEVVSFWNSTTWKATGRFTAAQVREGRVPGLSREEAHLLSEMAIILESQSQGVLPSRDGHWLVQSGPGDASSSTIELRDLHTPCIGHIWEAYGDVESFAFDPHGRFLIHPEATTDESQTPLGTILLEMGEKPLQWQGHMGAVESLDLDREGRWLVSGGQDWKVRLWDTATGKLVREFLGHRASLDTVRISGDGAWIASRADHESQIRIWDAATGKETRRLPVALHKDFSHFRFHPTQPWVLVPTPAGLEIWDATTGEKTRTLVVKPASDRTFTFTTDNRLMAVLAGGEVTLLDAATLEPIGTLPTPLAPKPLPRQEGGETFTPELTPFAGGHLVFSTDGSQLWWCTAWEDGGEASWGALWDMGTKALLHSSEELGHPPKAKTPRFPLHRDPYSDQHVGTANGKVRANGFGFEAGC